MHRSRVSRSLGPVVLLLASLVLTLMSVSALADSPEVEAKAGSEASAKTTSSTTPTVPEAGVPAGERHVIKVVQIEGEVPPTPDALVMVRDEETGEFRAPTASERQAMSATMDPLNRSSAGLKEIHYSDGSVAVDLQGRFQHATVTRLEGGKLVYGCSHDAEHVHGELTRAPTSTSTEEVRDDR